MLCFKTFISILIICVNFFQIAFSQKQDSTDNSAVFKGPLLKRKTVKKIALSLTENVTDEKEKALALYTYLINNLKLDVGALNNDQISIVNPLNILKQKKALHLGYATLYQALCMEANLKCLLVPGYIVEAGQTANDPVIQCNHTWNLVNTGSDWILVDPTLGAGFVKIKEMRFRKFLYEFFHIPYLQTKRIFVKKPDFAFFAPAPESFLLDHLPAAPYFQLTNPAIPLTIFFISDEAVVEYLNNHDPNPNFSFKDSINQLEYIGIEQGLKVAFSAKNFNPKNNHSIAMAYLTKSNELIEQAKNLSADESSIISIYTDAKNAAKLSDKYLNLYQKDLADYYNYTFKKLKAIHDSIFVDNKIFLRDNDIWIRKNYDFMRSVVRNNNKLKTLNSKFESPYTISEKSIDGIQSKYLKFKYKGMNDTINKRLETYEQSAQSNYDKIKENFKQTEEFAASIEQCKNDLIDNDQLIRDDFDANKKATEDVIEKYMLFTGIVKKDISLKRFEIRQRKFYGKIVRQTNTEIILDSDNSLKAIVKLANESRKIIQKNDPILHSAKIYGKPLETIDAEIDQIQLQQFKIYNQIIKTNLETFPMVRADIKRLKKEQKLIRFDNKVENLRYNREVTNIKYKQKRENKKFARLKISSLKNQKICDEQIKILKEIMKGIRKRPVKKTR